jgi:DNA-nicking Smr family endonuclease
MKEKPFHNPFSKLKGVVLTKPKDKEKEKPPKGQKPPAKKGPEEDGSLFTQAMDGVTPLENDLVAPEPKDGDIIMQQVLEGLKKQDQEVIDSLHALVNGKLRFDITCTGEYLEGHIIALDPRVLKKLKEGEFTVQAHLDLHGYVKDEARTLLSSFIRNSHATGFRTVLVIHGRGLKSDAGPILKESVVHWLTTGTLSHLVLAFCSARPCDGGTGALYVLLKKSPTRSKWKKTV